MSHHYRCSPWVLRGFFITHICRPAEPVSRQGLVAVDHEQ